MKPPEFDDYVEAAKLYTMRRNPLQALSMDSIIDYLAMVKEVQTNRLREKRQDKDS